MVVSQQFNGREQQWECPELLFLLEDPNAPVVHLPNPHPNPQLRLKAQKEEKKKEVEEKNRVRVEIVTQNDGAVVLDAVVVLDAAVVKRYIYI